MKKSTILRSAALLGAVVILAAAALSAASVDAAKPTGSGGRHGGGGTPGGSATLSLKGTNPCAIPCTATVHGSGFTAGGAVSVGLQGDYNWARVTADSSGGFDWTYPTILTWAGSYTIGANSLDGKSAAVTFLVQ
jgi:hypothetical protein